MGEEKPNKFPAPPPPLGTRSTPSASTATPLPRALANPDANAAPSATGRSAGSQGLNYSLPLPPPPPPPPSVRTFTASMTTTRPVEETAQRPSMVAPDNAAVAPPPPPPTLQPHESVAPTFVLQSAPPSANLDWTSARAAAGADSAAAASAAGGYGSAVASSTGPTIVSLPPPPPPPPPRQGAGGVAGRPGGYSPVRSRAAAPSAAAPTPPQSSVAATAPLLPPPPILRPPRVRTVSPPPPQPASASFEDKGDAANAGSGASSPDEKAEPPVAAQGPPPRLAPATFLPHRGRAPAAPPPLAKRQTHLPILVLATESANAVAHKNGLRLADLLEGLVQQQQSQQSPSPSSAATAATSSSSSPSYPFRSVSRQIHVTDAAVRFLEPDELYRPPGDDEAQAILYRHALLRDEDGNLQHELTMLEEQVDHLLEEAGDSSRGNDSSLSEMDRHSDRETRMEQAVKDAYALTSPIHIPWLWRYRVALDSVTDGLPWDLASAPVLVLCVCTTSEEVGTVETLQALVQSPYALPRPYHSGLLDPAGVRKEVLVLHDNVDGPRAGGEGSWNEPALRQTLQRQFGANASVVRCNSISVETSRQLALEESSDLWGGGGALGNCLSVSDRVSLRKYLTALLTSAVLPAMERRIADLNAVVSEKKKGVKNVLKSLWGAGRSSAGSASSAGGGGSSSHGGSAVGSDGTPTKAGLAPDDRPVAYRYDSIESQTRLLADSLFLMKDYDAALGMYRLIRDDFKQDKAHGHYASAQEMMALCMYLTDPYGRSKEIFSYCENALLGYSRAAEDERPPTWETPGRPSKAPRSTRSATRLCLVLISTKNICVDRHLEVADLLASASSHETSLGAAVLLEQSSSHYFMAEMYRKYAFHMLMSGHMFRSAEQEHHAFRCFTSALHIYRDSKWEELHNHLRSALAAQLYAMNRMALSLQLYAKLVGSTEGGRVSAKTQQKFVSHLLEICNEHPKKALVGADRMAASAKLSGELRDSARMDRLDRIVQVIRYTKSASRVLELPNMSLPGIDDSTVVVLADDASSNPDSLITSLGEAQRGSEAIWDELQLVATSELKVLEGVTKSTEEEVPLAALGKIEDAELRKVVAQIDREKANRSLQERARKRDGHNADIPIRAQMEPVVVEFAMSNPLGIPIDLADMQLVARMADEAGTRVCTNEDAIRITPLVSFDQKEEWSFLGSSVTFEVPDFCRVSSGASDSTKEAWKAAQEVEPFFVVTKTDVSFEPESRRTISASICPLTRGSLHILGIRGRLLDDVWVFHPFDLKGPLLQNSRSNRANRVRGEPTLLKAKVERGMPCLKADLVRTNSTESDEHGPLLEGQVSRWVLRLTNVGTAPARNFFLKTNLPWLCVESDSFQRSDASPEMSELPFCVGLSGTLFRLPSDASPKNHGAIIPGESTDIPVRVRATGAGRQDFYLLIRYELSDNDSSNSPSRFRWLRKMIQVPIYPSLTLSALIYPSAAQLDNHILSVVVTNDRTDRPDKLELALDKVSLVSRSYVLEPVPGQFGATRAILGWQERATVYYRLVPHTNKSGNLWLNQCGFERTQDRPILKPASSASTLSFPCAENAFETFESAMKSHGKAAARAAAAQGQEQDHPRSIAQIRRANTSVLSFSSSASGRTSHSHATAAARLCPPDGRDESLCLVISWMGDKSNVVGEHYFRDLSIRSAMRTKECPIAVIAQHPQVCSIARAVGPALVPITVTLRNVLTKESVEFQFSVDQGDGFDYIGPECFESALSGGEEVSVSLQALIPNPGVYDLQRIRLKIDGEDPYVFPMQWLVAVHAS